MQIDIVEDKDKGTVGLLYMGNGKRNRKISGCNICMIMNMKRNNSIFMEYLE